ncbi:Uncharacterised protein [Vibrio cholerae]|nr:Uncharacterised protein [Vibrio cholerae]
MWCRIWYNWLKISSLTRYHMAMYESISPVNPRY